MNVLLIIFNKNPKSNKNLFLRALGVYFDII